MDLRFRKQFKTCPTCGWEIRSEAIKCRYCGNFLDEASEGREVCWLCRIVMGISGLILLVGLAVFILGAGR